MSQSNARGAQQMVDAAIEAAQRGDEAATNRALNAIQRISPQAHDTTVDHINISAPGRNAGR